MIPIAPGGGPRVGFKFNQGDENDERAMVAPGLGAGVGPRGERRLVGGARRRGEDRIPGQFRSERIASGLAGAGGRRLQRTRQIVAMDPRFQARHPQSGYRQGRQNCLRAIFVGPRPRQQLRALFDHQAGHRAARRRPHRRGQDQPRQFGQGRPRKVAARSEGRAPTRARSSSATCSI